MRKHCDLRVLLPLPIVAAHGDFRMHIIVMGAAGAGKSTVGRMLAASLGRPFYDGDTFHSKSSIEKMRRGESLTDQDRWPWLDALGALLEQSAAAGQSIVLACSALKQSYRDRLVSHAPDVTFVYLKADRELLRWRLQSRSGHYMSAALLDSQLSDLEEPEGAIVVDAAQSPDRIAAAVAAAVGRGQ